MQSGLADSDAPLSLETTMINDVVLTFDEREELEDPKPENGKEVGKRNAALRNAALRNAAVDSSFPFDLPPAPSEETMRESASENVKVGALRKFLAPSFLAPSQDAASVADLSISPSWFSFSNPANAIQDSFELKPTPPDPIFPPPSVFSPFAIPQTAPSDGPPIHSFATFSLDESSSNQFGSGGGNSSSAPPSPALAPTSSSGEKKKKPFRKGASSTPSSSSAFSFDDPFNSHF